MATRNAATLEEGIGDQRSAESAEPQLAPRNGRQKMPIRFAESDRAGSLAALVLAPWNTFMKGCMPCASWNERRYKKRRTTRSCESADDSFVPPAAGGNVLLKRGAPEEEPRDR